MSKAVMIDQRYEIKKKIAEGTYAKVYLAHGIRSKFVGLNWILGQFLHLFISAGNDRFQIINFCD